MHYTGVGSRTTPSEIQSRIVYIAEFLTAEFTLRSGAADGADKAFELGCDNMGGNKEIYLPWKGFNKNNSNLFGVDNEAIELARKYHPHYDHMAPKAQLLIARNGYQVLGADLKTPSEFLICYTPDGATTNQQRGKSTGGTGQAISIAESYDIPIFNLQNQNGLEKFRNYLNLFYNLDF